MMEPRRATVTAGQDIYMVTRHLRWTLRQEDTHLEWLGTFPALEQANAAARHFKDGFASRAMQGKQCVWSERQLGHGQIIYLCSNLAHGHELSIRVQKESRCYCHVSGGARRVGCQPEPRQDTTGWAQKGREHGIRRKMKEQVAQHKIFIAGLRAELLAEIVHGTTHPSQGDAMDRVQVVDDEQCWKQLKDAIKEQYHRDLTDALREDMRKELWYDLVGESAHRNEAWQGWPSNPPKPRQAWRGGSQQDVLVRMIDGIDTETAEDRILGTEMLTAALSRVVGVSLNDKQKRSLESEVKEMVHMVRPMVPRTGNAAEVLQDSSLAS